MKKIIFYFLLLPLSIFAQSYLISNVPIPKLYIQDLDPYPCNEKCLQEYIDNDRIFSFLSHIESKLKNKELDEIRMMSISLLNLGSNMEHDKLRIALLLPYKIIGKYAASTTNASFAYLIARNRSFELKSYKIENENEEDIKKALIEINKDGFEYVIAPLTKNGADIIANLDPKTNVFFPTINKQDVDSTSEYLYYGGIDYRAQNDMLLQKSVSPLVIFNDKSSIGKQLASYQKNKFTELNVSKEKYMVDIESSSFIDYDETNQTIDYYANTSEYLTKEQKVIVNFLIPKRTTNLEYQLSDNNDIKHGTFFLNTPIVKTGMILSQITLYDSNATNVYLLR